MKLATLFVLLLFILSGLSGLIYEIVWIRMLSHLLGGTNYAISIVLAAFMGGLAIGSRFFGHRADSTPRPLQLFAKLELGIAACGALVYTLIRLAPPVYVAVAGAVPETVLALMRFVLTGILLLPPTFLMGGTLPVLSRFIVKSRKRIGRGLGLLYSLNTLGAVLGSFLTGFVLIKNLGLAGSTALAIVFNVVIGVAVWFIDRSVEPVTAIHTGTPQPEGGKKKPAVRKSKTIKHKETAEMNYFLLASIFTLSGFASLGYELYWTRALQHFLGNSTYAFSAMLTTFLLGLAAGSWVGGRWVDRVASPGRLLGWVQVMVGVFAMMSVLLIWQWLPQVENSRWLSNMNLGWNNYLLRRFVVAFSVMALPTFLTGMTFPIVNRIGIRRLERLGEGVGDLYFANTVGSILGALTAGFVALPLLGAKGALIATAVLSVALGLLAHLGNHRRARFEAAAATVLFVLLIVGGPRLKAAREALLSNTQDAGDEVLFDAEDHEAETRIYRKPSGIIHMSIDGHYIVSNELNTVRKEKILAHLPMVLCPEARRVLAVGLGSGITLGTLALYEGLESLKCIEIVPGVTKGARFFSNENRNIMNNPRVNQRVGDGVQYLLTTTERFDIVSSDAKLNLECAANTQLLSQDYYELCRDRLTDRGVMVQWLPLHFPVSEVKIITRSFVRAFPHVGVYWYNASNIILAGGNKPMVMDMDSARRHAAHPLLGEDLSSVLLDDIYVVATLWVCDGNTLLQELGDGPVNSWQRPLIEFTLLRNYLNKTRAYHEDDMLRWLQVLRNVTSQRLTGEYDPAIYERYLVSAGKLMEGFSQSGGITRYDNKINIFKDALMANPEDPRLKEIVETVERAESDIEEAFTSGQINTPEKLVEVGILRRSQGRHEEALELFERAYTLRPDDPNIQYNRLLAFKSLGRKAAFRLALSIFLESFPRDARGHSLQGREFASANDFDKAAASFTRAVELDPESPIYRNNLATALARLERYQEAARIFEEVCGRQPHFEGAAYSAAACFSMAGKPKEAAKWARFCIDEGLVKPSRFAHDPLFANLRGSKYWDSSRAQPK